MALGIFDTGIFDTGIFDHADTRKPGVNFDFGISPVQGVGDTRWQGVRQAREAARVAVQAVQKAKTPQRREAAEKAAEAVATVARSLVANPARPLPTRDTGAWDTVLADLEALQAYLAGLIEADRIKAQAAREAAERWALIEAELRLEQETVEELAIVFALAL